MRVAASVGGRIVELPVTDNQRVAKGDVLFRLDPVPYRLAVAQAEADLSVARAGLETQRRAITREQAQRGELRYALKHAFNGALTPMLQCLLESRDLSPAELNDIKQLIAKYSPGQSDGKGGL